MSDKLASTVHGAACIVCGSPATGYLRSATGEPRPACDYHVRGYRRLARAILRMEDPDDE